MKKRVKQFSIEGRPFAAPLPPWRPHSLAGRLLLRGPRAVALSQPRALRYIRQRRPQAKVDDTGPVVKFVSFSILLYRGWRDKKLFYNPRHLHSFWAFHLP